MKKFTAILLFFTSICMLRVGAEDNYIFWQIDGYTDKGDKVQVREIGGNLVDIADIVGRGGAAEGLSVNAVRVKMTTGSGDVYLNLGGFDSDTGEIFWGDDVHDGTRYPMGSFIDTDGDFYDPPGQVVAPPDDPWVWDAGPAVAAYDAAYNGDPSVSFMFELGNWTEDGQWIILAASESAGMADLQGHVFAGDLSAVRITPWNGGSYAVPEPNSAILLLIGSGLLSLRRRRRSICR